MKLEGKVAIVTGGGAGIGQGIVHCLAEEGADVAIVDINRDNAKKVADEVKSLDRKSLAIEADLTDTKQVAQAVKDIINTFGKIDILVNNVGGPGKIWRARTSPEFVDQEEAEWDEIYNLNLKSHVMMSRAVAPYFIKQKSGKIVNISSCAGKRVQVSAYSTIKDADIHFTRGLAAELAKYNINVNSVCPGIVDTEFHYRSEEWLARNAPGMTYKEYFEKYLVAPTPLKRAQTPKDIGRAVVFLVSEDGKNITGQALSVDGGRVMR